jgi:hypothetical protein
MFRSMKLRVRLILLACIALCITVVILVAKRHNATQPANSALHKASEPIDATKHSVSAPTKKSEMIRSDGSPKETRKDQMLKALSKVNLSSEVRAIVGLDPKATDINTRRKELQKLTKHLAEDDVKALVMFLDSISKDEKDITPDAFNAFKNDVLDILLRQDKIPDGLGGQLVKMFKDKEHDDVWRDYCIQYMAGYYESKWPAGGGKTEDAERKNIESAYWAAVGEKNKTFPGTALLALERLSRDNSEFDRGKVGEKALELAMDDQSTEANRITSLRLCGMINKPEILPTARVLAQTGSTGPIRMAAVATVGDVGDQTDIELLQSLAGGSDKQAKVVAESALNRLNQRLAGQESK